MFIAFLQFFTKPANPWNYKGFWLFGGSSNL